MPNWSNLRTLAIFIGVSKNHIEELRTFTQTPNISLSFKVTLGIFRGFKIEIWKESSICMVLFPAKKTSQCIKWCILIEYYVFLRLFGLIKYHEDVMFLKYFDFECSEYTQSYFG